MYNVTQNDRIWKKFWWNWIHVFLIEDDELLKRDDKIWDRASNKSKKEYNSEQGYNENIQKLN